MTTRGFLVVERLPKDAVPSNPRYRGIDRLPPWSQTHYEKGFDDPYVFARLTDSRGLLPTKQAAEAVIAGYNPVYDPDQLEVIWVTEDTNVTPSSLEQLGYDVAGASSPFYSLLGDPPVDTGAREMLSRVNAYGLFPDISDARKYRRIVSSIGGPDYGPLAIWKIFRIAEDRTNP